MITIIGAGLAGSLLALELAALGCSVRLIDAPEAGTATALSYGLLPPGRGAPWHRLRATHGIEGLQRRWLQFGPRGLPLPGLQVDPQRFASSMMVRLDQLGVRRVCTRLSEPQQLDPLLADGPVVLACGSGCRHLAPRLSNSLRSSWAGILELPLPGPTALARLPARLERPALERRAPGLQQEEWIVDPALVPCGTRLLAGQITLVSPGLETLAAPDPAAMERRLRQALARRWPRLAQGAGRYRQVPVSFCSDGVPLAERCGPDLWVLAGFSNAFSELPAAAASLAHRIHTSGH